MPSQEISGTTALVTGASRGFGRGIATALAQAGANVVGVARDRARLDELRAQLGGTFIPVAADAADPVVAGQLLDEYRPRTLVLNAGAAPLSRPIHQQTWQRFSRNWDVDVQHVFGWTREALLLPLEPGSVVIAFSSGAALRGSPLSGGYAGAKATIRFIAAYAAEESGRYAMLYNPVNYPSGPPAAVCSASPASLDKCAVAWAYQNFSNVFPVIPGTDPSCHAGTGMTFTATYTFNIVTPISLTRYVCVPLI